jgi:hypothetical protein
VQAHRTYPDLTNDRRSYVAAAGTFLSILKVFEDTAPNLQSEIIGSAQCANVRFGSEAAVTSAAGMGGKLTPTFGWKVRSDLGLVNFTFLPNH